MEYEEGSKWWAPEVFPANQSCKRKGTPGVNPKHKQVLGG